MNQKTLVQDLARLEEQAAGLPGGTDLLLHIARVRERAENGYYHLKYLEP